MGCASAKHVSTVQNEEETQKGKNYQNGDVFGDEYRIKPVEEVKYMKNGGEDDQKIAARNQENLRYLMGMRKGKKVMVSMKAMIDYSGDIFVIAHGSSDRQIKARVETEEKKLMVHSFPKRFADAAVHIQHPGGLAFKPVEKSASSNARLKSNKEIPGLVHQPRANMHISESQQEFFRMLDEKIEKGRDYCSEEEDVT